MSLYGPSTATATVAANTNVVTIAGMDLNAVVQQGMTINLGARDRAIGDAWIINTVVPNGANGGTLTTAGTIPTAYTNAPFLIDTRGFLGTDSSYAAAVSLKLLSTLSNLLGSATNLFTGSRQVALDKLSGTAVGRILFQIAGRSWAGIEQRTFAYTPTGGQATSIETVGVRAYPDGTTPTDALLIDLSNGTGDLRAGTVTMASASTVDLSSAPAKRVAITGSATINSLGPGRNLERIVHVVNGGGTLTHNATSLILPGRSNITMEANDWFHATSDAAGNWRVGSYQRASGQQVGFPPVQQGGGAGQSSNKIFLGWSPGTGLKAQVDSSDLGLVWSDFTAGKSLVALGYQRLPSGLILQWGRSVSSAPDYTQGFATAFPNAALGVVATIEVEAAFDRLYGVTVQSPTKTSFIIRVRNAVNGGGVGRAGDLPVNWFAWGY